MVHLSMVPSDTAAMKAAVQGLEKLEFKTQESESVHASVYGSKYAARDLPKNEMPDEEMPREVSDAQRLPYFVPSMHVCLTEWSANLWAGCLSHD